MEHKKPIEAGDTVRLKSGGPLMTVTKITGEEVAVSWFQDGLPMRHQDKYPRVALVHSEPTDRFPP